jgi:ferritin
LEHENGVTDMINNLVKIIQKLEFIGKDGRRLLMIDKDLADRVFTVPAATEF